MRAELVLFGKRVSMARRARRRTLVVVVHLAIAVSLWFGWTFDKWNGLGLSITLVVTPLAYSILGGFNGHGLVPPFSKWNRPVVVKGGVSIWSKIDRWFWVFAPEESELEPDEREEQQIDRAHRYSHRFLAGVLGLIVLMLYTDPNGSGSLGFEIPRSWVLTTALGGFVLSATMPQSIILWTEPDMEEGR